MPKKCSKQRCSEGLHYSSAQRPNYPKFGLGYLNVMLSGVGFENIVITRRGAKATPLKTAVEEVYLL